MIVGVTPRGSATTEKEETMKKRTDAAPAPADVESAVTGKVTRKRLLRGGGAAVAGAVLAGSVAAASAKAATAKKVTYDIGPDLATLKSTWAPESGDPWPTGPFYVEGSIYKKGTLGSFGQAPFGAPPLGTFRSRGWIIDPKTFNAVVNESYELSGAGDIQTQGRQGTGTRTALGGTGRFVNVRPTAGVQIINPTNLAFRITFTYS